MNKKEATQNTIKAIKEEMEQIHIFIDTVFDWQGEDWNPEDLKVYCCLLQALEIKGKKVDQYKSEFKNSRHNLFEQLKTALKELDE